MNDQPPPIPRSDREPIWPLVIEDFAKRFQDRAGPGTAVEFGIDIQPFFDEVHRTNMLKVGGTTREDGKTLKPPGWEPPRIREMLEAIIFETSRWSP
jgi:hypothetical protein